ncbi:MAG: type II secretion system F family protein [Opitutaceae bacterium]|nr:type II secretion system F family protein [Opitutaceae bacterium]
MTATLAPESAIAAADQLSLLLSSGVPLELAIQTVITESDDTALRKMLVEVHRRLCYNGKVAEAFSAFPRQFPPHLLAVIQVGHETGMLAASFAELSRLWKEESEVRSVVRRATTYPAIAGTLMAAVVGFLFFYVLPMFEKVYSDLGVALPPLTKFYMSASNLVKTNVGAVTLSLGALSGMVICFARSPLFKRKCSSLMADLPVIGNLVQNVALARIIGVLGALSRAGVAVQDSVRLCKSGGGNAAFDAMMVKVGGDVASGSFLSDAFERTGRVPAMAVASIRIGEKTNRLTEALEQVRGYLSQAARDQLQRNLQLIEPVLTVFLGLVVGTVAVSLFHPLVTLAMSIKR